jgi:hypothetical protein
VIKKSSDSINEAVSILSNFFFAAGLFCQFVVGGFTFVASSVMTGGWDIVAGTAGTTLASNICG